MNVLLTMQKNRKIQGFIAVFLQGNVLLSSLEGVRKMFGKQEVKVFLEEKNIPFEWVEHKAVYTIDEMEELGLESMDEIAKNLF